MIGLSLHFYKTVSPKIDVSLTASPRTDQDSRKCSFVSIKISDLTAGQISILKPF